ncbi:dTMP kinase [Plasmodiophora brassicae]
MCDRREDLASRLTEADCSTVYNSLQDCLVVNERDWTACQVQVKAFRECFEAAKKAGVKVEPKHQRSNL